LDRALTPELLPNPYPIDMHASSRRLLLVAALLIFGRSAAAELIFDQTLSDTNWSISSGTTAGISPTVQFLSATGAIELNGGRHALRFFTNPGELQRVSAGGVLEVTFDLNFPETPANVANGLRVGVFNSPNADSRPPAGLTGTTAQRQDAFTAYKGYAFGWNPNPGVSVSNQLFLNERVPNLVVTGANRLLSTFTDVYIAPPSQGTSPIGQSFSSGVSYRASYSVTGLADGALSFAFSVTNEPSPGQTAIQFSNSVTISNPSTRDFDSFAIFAHSSITSFQIDTVKVTYTAVPEPSTYAACAGAAVLGLAFWRRRRAAAKALAA
jgi:hypothetical protein